MKVIANKINGSFILVSTLDKHKKTRLNVYSLVSSSLWGLFLYCTHLVSTPNQLKGLLSSHSPTFHFQQMDKYCMALILCRQIVIFSVSIDSAVKQLSYHYHQQEAVEGAQELVPLSPTIQLGGQAPAIMDIDL